jgi:hypothetical protein
MQTASNAIVLIAACVALATALVPLWKWAWRTYLVRHFDAKKQRHNELIEDAKWFEDRALKLDTFRKQLIYAKMYEKPPDRFKLAEMISKLDRRDAEWVRTVEDTDLLAAACERNQEECLINAGECRSFADDVARKVLFW